MLYASSSGWTYFVVRLSILESLAKKKQSSYFIFFLFFEEKSFNHNSAHRVTDLYFQATIIVCVQLRSFLGVTR